MATIHMVLQGKGGVGKSFVAATMAQFLRDRGHQPLCVDTDPINKTFAGYKAFDVHRLELMDGNEVDPRRFDLLIELLAAAEPQQHVVIDNGASSFIPLADYLLSCEVPAMLAELGHSLYLHCVITGGQGQVDTLQGLSSLLANFACPCVVWLNPLHGRIEHKGKGFEDFEIYQKRRDRIAALVRIPELNPKTSGRDLSELLRSRRSFSDILQDETAPLMTRQRLRMVQRDLYASVLASGVL